VPRAASTPGSIGQIKAGRRLHFIFINTATQGPDILWQNTTDGTPSIWLMNGLTSVAEAAFEPAQSQGPMLAHLSSCSSYDLFSLNHNNMSMEGYISSSPLMCQASSPLF